MGVLRLGNGGHRPVGGSGATEFRGRLRLVHLPIASGSPVLPNLRFGEAKGGCSMRQVKRHVVLLSAALALTAGACSSSDKSTTSTNPTGSGGGSVQGLGIDYSKLAGPLTGSGSSFQAPFQHVMVAAFQEKAFKVTINFGAGGS